MTGTSSTSPRAPPTRSSPASNRYISTAALFQLASALGPRVPVACKAETRDAVGPRAEDAAVRSVVRSDQRAGGAKGLPMSALGNTLK